MLKFVIDEDIPRSTGIILKENGYDVLDIRLSTYQMKDVSLHITFKDYGGNHNEQR